VHFEEKDPWGQSCFERLDPKPDTHTLTVYPGAQLAKLKEKSPGMSPPQRGGGRRGPSSNVFTKRQRRTLEKRLGKLDLSVPFDFVTLTYADNYGRCPERGFPCDPEIYRNDLDRFWGRLEYQYQQVGLIWRLEFQAGRGAPHYHLLLYGLTDRSCDEVQVELAKLWADVTGVEFERVLEGGVDVRRPKTLSQRKESFTYMAKRHGPQLTSPYIEHRRRFWHWKGKKHLPQVSPVTIQLEEDEGFSLRRSMRRYRDKTSSRKIGAQPHNASITLRRGCGDSWLRWAACILGDREFVDTRNGEVVKQRDIQHPARAESRLSGRAEDSLSDAVRNEDTRRRCVQYVVSKKRRAAGREPQEGARGGVTDAVP